MCVLNYDDVFLDELVVFWFDLELFVDLFVGFLMLLVIMFLLCEGSVFVVGCIVCLRFGVEFVNVVSFMLGRCFNKMCMCFMF